MSNTGRKSRRRPQRKINQNMKEKLLILFGIVLLLLVILVLRITYINATSGSKYKKQVLSQAQQKYESQVLPAKRGDIYDKNGNILATSNKVYNVILDCKTVNSDEDYVEPTIRALNEVLGIDEETVRSLLADSRTSQSQYQVLTKQLSMDKKKEFEKYKAEDEDSGLTKAQAKERANIKGVWFEEDYLRSYPFNETACDTIGFALDRDVADIGLEGYYNSTLTGVDGRQYGYINDDSDVEQTIIAAVNGKSIQTSIDIGAQQIVEKYVNGFKEAMGAKNIGVIVENPSTGEIIAMDGGDRYDLNNPRDLSKYYTEEEITGMSSDDKIDALNELWRNFCVSDTFEPGSTIKPFTVATGLEIGALKGDETYYCGGSLQIDEWEIKCISYDNGGHGQQNLTQVMENSCNVALMQIGLAIGPEEFCKYQSIFGFGQYTGIDLPGEAVGILQSPDGMIKTDLATNSFGQNFNVTMLQLATGFCSLINGGDYYEPHLVKAIQDENGNVIQTIDPVLEKKTISKETSDKLKSYMYSVVQNGSGRYAQVEGYDIGAKTGTAEKLPRGENKNVVSFIGYAPAYNPQVLCYVVVDTPHLPGEQQAHSTFASEIFSKIMAEVLPYKNVFPAGGAAQDLETNLSSQEEGIISGTATEDPNAAETPAETTPAPEGGWANYDEEFIDSGDEYSYPDTMGNVQDESAAVGNGETAETGRDTGTADNE